LYECFELIASKGWRWFVSCWIRLITKLKEKSSHSSQEQSLRITHSFIEDHVSHKEKHLIADVVGCLALMTSGGFSASMPGFRSGAQTLKF
jgi:hypothetical protein